VYGDLLRFFALWKLCLCPGRAYFARPPVARRWRTKNRSGCGEFSRAQVQHRHLRFAIRGCLAASGCYITYNSIAWPGISAPAIATCLLTAVSAVGASQQRQILRFAAFVLGGLLIGIGSEIFILPHFDSIGGFTLFFVVVMTLVSWLMSSSSRFSYFGFQIAVVFCLINLQEFARQTSLAAARDQSWGRPRTMHDVDCI
jgi:uncharacterized membrane protein YccC